MRKNILGFFIVLLFQTGCANIKLVSSENNQHKFCTNPRNQVAQNSDFDAAAADKCGGKYRNISSGYEFFSDPSNPKIGGVLEVQADRRLCRTYECKK